MLSEQRLLAVSSPIHCMRVMLVLCFPQHMVPRAAQDTEMASAVLMEAPEALPQELLAHQRSACKAASSGAQASAFRPRAAQEEMQRSRQSGRRPRRRPPAGWRSLAAPRALA